MKYKFCVIILQLFSIVFCVKYKMVYKGHEYCVNPDPPYEKNKKVDVSIALINDTERAYYNANLTVRENLRGYAWRLKHGFERAGKVYFENDFKGLTCKSFIFKIISELSTIKFNPDTCTIFKGNYTISKLEIASLDRAVNYLPTRRFGISVYYLSYYKPKGTCVCIQSRVLFTKL